jgi:hypothetical protein
VALIMMNTTGRRGTWCLDAHAGAQRGVDYSPGRGRDHPALRRQDVVLTLAADGAQERADVNVGGASAEDLPESGGHRDDQHEPTIANAALDRPSSERASQS